MSLTRKDEPVCKLCGKPRKVFQVFCGAACSAAWEMGQREVSPSYDETEAASGVRPITPEQLYDLVSKTYANVAIVKMGDTWVFGRMVPLAEVAEDAKVRRLGQKYGIEVIAESTVWAVLVATVLKTKGG